jgi:uncharacterized membrane protein (Fun14 family)
MAKQEVMHWYETLRAKLAGYPEPVIDGIIFASLGFVLGFLLKTLGRQLIVALLIAVVLFWAADYFHVITIHAQDLHTFLGIPSFGSFEEFKNVIIGWVQAHTVGAIALVIGCLLGWRLGF